MPITSSKTQLVSAATGAGAGDGPKPMNVFYVWYTELCRRAGTHPLSYVKPAKLKKESVLDFVCDRMKPEDWVPVVAALRLDHSLHVIGIHSRNRCKYLPEVDTEEKAKHMKRRAGSVHTTYVSRTLLKALCQCVRRSVVLSSLELDGISVGVEDVELLIEALKKQKVLKVLVLKHSSIRDEGCQLLCQAIRELPSLEVLNLTACALSTVSAQYIAKVIKFQQINRYCESWHNSLRYEDPDVGIMAGLKRITLNCNPNIGDEGLTFILDELDDDLWIKALDMQRCGITDASGIRLLNMVEFSRSMEIADFRNNDLAQDTLDRIFEMLKTKHFGSHCEFKWCFTTSTLRAGGTSTNEPPSNTSVFYPPGKSRSVPIKNSTSMTPVPLRRTRTSSILAKQPTGPCRQPTMMDFQRSLTSLNAELQKETRKRMQSEQENKRLKDELLRIRSMSTIASVSVTAMPKKEPTQEPLQLDMVKMLKNCKTTKPAMKTAKLEGKELRPVKNVEFVFSNTSLASDIMQNLVAQSDSGDQSDDEMSIYFQDIVSEDAADNDDDRPKKKDSRESLMAFVHDVTTSSPAAWRGDNEQQQRYAQKVQ